MVHLSPKGSENNDVVVKLVGGGNIISRRPVFSADGKNVFIVRGKTIRSYSLKTGDYIQDYDGFSSDVVGVQFHPYNNQVLVACSDKGELIEWEWQTKLPGKMKKLKLGGRNLRHFHLITCRSSKERMCYDVLGMVPSDNKNILETSVFCGTKGNSKATLSLKLADSSHSFAYGNYDGEEFFAGIHKNVLVAMRQSNFSEKVFTIDKKTKDRYTCVSCHHARQIIAAGDSKGRIHIYHNPLKSNGTAVRMMYHWHHLSVRDIVFSYAGSFFYSGGSECVLVKWTLDSPNDKSFLPRLPAPILHLSMGPDNQFVGVATDDNAIQIVDPHKHITTVIQHLTWGVTVGLDKEPFVAGIVLDPRTKTLILNGRVGHVQFFSPLKKSLMYNLDITGQNYMTQEDSRVIVNTDVVATAVSSDGLWLATIEERDDHETSLESRLKFWVFDVTKRTFRLNTSIELPHEGSVTSVKFRPTLDPQQMMAVTVGADCKFRLWSLTSNNSLAKPGMMWQCESVGFHKSLPTGATSFSSDGSLLAVSFSATLTVWLPDTNQLKSSLSHLDLKHPIRCVEFGCKESSHLVVTASDICIGVWNLLSLSLASLVEVNISLLTADPFSNFFAAFTPDNSMFVFSANSCTPVFMHKNVTGGNSKILAAAFAPRSTPQICEQLSWLSHSQLYFINSNQEMLTLDAADHLTDVELFDALPRRSNTPQTPFAALKAQQSSSGVERLKPTAQPQLGVAGASIVDEFIHYSAHTMPSLTLLCDSFLRSLAIKTPVVPEAGNADVMDVDSDTEEKKFDDKIKAQNSCPDLDLKKNLQPLLNHSYKWVTKLIQRSK